MDFYQCFSIVKDNFRTFCTKFSCHFVPVVHSLGFLFFIEVYTQRNKFRLAEMEAVNYSERNIFQQGVV